MKLLRFALLLLLPVLVAPLALQALDVRHPAQGLPAYAFLLPDGWDQSPMDDGNLLLLSPNRSTVIVIYIGESDEDLDQLATDSLVVAKASPFSRHEPAEISGFKGKTYFSTLTNERGVNTNLELTIVRVDENHIATCTLILSAGLPKADETAGRLVRNGLRLRNEE